MVLATTDPLLLGLTWAALVVGWSDYALLVRRRAGSRSKDTPSGENDEAVLRHMVQVLLIDPQVRPESASSGR